MSFPNRIGTNSSKWRISETNPNMVSASLADMDFEIPEFIRSVFLDYMALDFMGYSYQSEKALEAILNWEKKEHGYYFDKEKLILLDSVMTGVANAIQAFTNLGDAVLINDPVYPSFKQIIENNGRKPVSSELEIKDGVYRFNFEKFEDCIITNKVKVFVLCNPHNPLGRAWEIAELNKIGNICLKYNVIVISDEIHQDLVLFGNKHNSFNTVNNSFKNISIILSSPTKTFNFSGFKIAYSIVENETLHAKLLKNLSANNQPMITSINYRFLEIAYNHGRNWLEELHKVIEENIDFVVDYFEKKLPKLLVYKSQATYLLWIDFSRLGLNDSEILDLLNEANVMLSDGARYGNLGTNYVRLNVATPKAVLEVIVKRIFNVFSGL